MIRNKIADALQYYFDPDDETLDDAVESIMRIIHDQLRESLAGGESRDVG